MRETGDLQVYTTWSAARKLMVTPTTVIKWIKDGELKTIKTVGGHRRIPAEEVNRLWKKMSKDFE